MVESKTCQCGAEARSIPRVKTQLDHGLHVVVFIWASHYLSIQFWRSDCEDKIGVKIYGIINFSEETWDMLNLNIIFKLHRLKRWP